MGQTSSSNPGRLGGLTTGQGLSLAGAILTVIAVFLPWITVSVLGQTGSANGLDMLDANALFNGVVTLLLAVVVALVVLAGSWNETTQAVALVFGALVALIGVIYVVDPSFVFGGGLGGRIAAGMSDVGIGIVVTILGGVIMVVGAGLDYLS